MHNKVTHFFSNMGFMFCRSWKLSRSIWVFSFLKFIFETLYPFVMLILPKYILDELAGARRMEVTLRYIGMYAAAIIFFNMTNLLLNRFSAVETIKVSFSTELDNQKKWLYMDYGNFENGQVRELAGRCVDQVEPQHFIGEVVLGFLKNAIQLTFHVVRNYDLTTCRIGIVIRRRLTGKKNCFRWIKNCTTKYITFKDYPELWG